MVDASMQNIMLSHISYENINEMSFKLISMFFVIFFWAKITTLPVSVPIGAIHFFYQ